MKVTVRFSGMHRTLAGVQSLVLDLEDGSTLHGLFGRLEGLLPQAFGDQVLKPLLTGQAPKALVLVNREHLQGQAVFERLLADGDVVAFVPPMEGG